MAGDVQGLVATAEEHLRRHRCTEAAKCFEQAAAAAQDTATRADLLMKAAAAHDEGRSAGDAGRCYRQAADLLEGTAKAACLMDWWRLLILAIAGYQYECGYEWRGDTTGGHDADSAIYRGLIGECRAKAEEVLAEALRVEGVNRQRIIGEAQEECRRRGKDGWGAQACREIVAKVAREVGDGPG